MACRDAIQLPAFWLRAVLFLLLLLRSSSFTEKKPMFVENVVPRQNHRLVFRGNANAAHDVLQLTPNTGDSEGLTVNKAGSAFFNSSYDIWARDQAKVEASFEISFCMAIYRPTQGPYGEGLAFVIAATPDGPPPGSEGGFLGLTNTTTRAVPRSPNSFVAVEFDTRKQPYDPDGNHIGVNIGSVVSDYNASLASSPNITLTPPPGSNVTCTVWIDYSAAVHDMSVYMAVDGQPKPTEPLLHATVDLSDHLPPSVFFGFSASTGVGFEHYTILRLDISIETIYCFYDPFYWVPHARIVVPTLFYGSIAATVVMIVAAIVFCRSKYYRALKMDQKLSAALQRLPGTPRKLRYTMVKKATNNFHETKKLGKGGFGTVYRGTLRLRSGKGAAKAPLEVAVKKFIRDDNRCYDDFLAEVDIINRLRHRHIVPLIGWCYEKGELLLVYEYMPNGSLDQHIFQHDEQRQEGQQAVMGWSTRYSVVVDVATGLHYVHHEHEHLVLHRDIKASNVMLDANFRGRLGDFGLARIVDFNKNSYTDLGVAGTWGFIAPEYGFCRKATRKTDVYAFGVLVLEVATGRRALSNCQSNEANDTFLLLTDWVWKFHSEGRLIEAIADGVASTEEFDSDSAISLLLLGLACCNPNPADRPSVAEVVHVLTKSALPPDVPLVKPTFVWPPEGGIPIDFDDVTSASDFLTEDWEEETSSNEEAPLAAISLSAPTQITRRNAACVRKFTSADQECCV